MANYTRYEVIKVLQEFLNENSGEYDWDDFISCRFDNSDLEDIRKRCANLSEEFPPVEVGHYCSVDGLKILRLFIFQLSAASA